MARTRMRLAMPSDVIALLAIARSGLRSHGGDVVLENRTEGGLRAHITLPVAAADLKSV